jgi:acetyl esterase/lipase
MDIPLWPSPSPTIMNVAFPAGPSAAPRPAFVVLRGGAYATSSGSGSGTARWLAERGVIAAEVPYRVGDGSGAFPACYADAARAVRVLRSRATELGVDAARIGVLGYSAGGHLASLLSTQPDLPQAADDTSSNVSARPDLVVLGYPLISFVAHYRPGAFVGSVENFFGGKSSDAQRRAFSNELHVTAKHPPVFIWTTLDDALVPAAHSTAFAEACERAGVDIELQLYPHGPHGLGLALGRGDEVGQWTSRLLLWLDARGWVKRAT